MYNLRAFDRQSTDGRIDYIYGGVRHSAHLRDMATTGCQLSLAGVVPETGDQLKLVLLEDLEVSGTIVWTNGDTVGVKFDLPVIEAVVRFFGLSGLTPSATDVTKDSFGRALPPLGQGGTRR